MLYEIFNRIRCFTRHMLDRPGAQQRDQGRATLGVEQLEERLVPTGVTLVNDPVSQQTGHFPCRTCGLTSSTMFFDLEVPEGENRLVAVVMSQTGNPGANFGAGLEDLTIRNAMSRVSQALAQGGTRTRIFVAPLGSGEAFTQRIAAGSTAPNFLTATVYLFEGVSQTTPVDAIAIGTRGSNGNAAAALQLSVASEVGDLVIEGITQNALFSGSPRLTPISDQTVDRNGDFGQSNIDAAAAHADGASTVEMHWSSVGGDPWIAHAVANINQDRLPVVLQSGPFSVDEHSAAGTVVGNMNATDGDGGDVDHGITYTILGGNTGNAFAIDASTGEITVNNPVVLDYESGPISYTLTVEVDDVGNKITQDITILLNDVNEAPLFADQSFSVPENSPVGTTVGTVVASDVDAGQVLQYSIEGDSATHPFEIDPVTGVISTNGSHVLDFETTASYQLSVVATDNGNPQLSTKAIVTIQVVDENEAPELALDATSTQVEEGKIAVTSGTFSDPENDAVTVTADRGTVTQHPDGTWTWSLVAVDGPDDTGPVTFTATDAQGLSTSQTFDLVVTNVAPILSVDQAAVSVAEGAMAQNSGSFSDPGNDVVQLSASVGTITDSGNGQWHWSWATSDGPEESQDVVITATDSDGASHSIPFSLVVENAIPSITLLGDSTIDEGSVYSLTLGEVADPGDDSVSQYIVDWGDGSSDTYTTAGTVSHTYADGSQSRTITVDLVDEDGAHLGAGSKTIQVANVAPAFDAGADELVSNATGIFVRAGIEIAEPGADTLSGTVNYGDGSGEIPLDIHPFDHTFDLNHTYGVEGAFTVVVSVTDGESSQVDSFLVEIELNTPPVAQPDHVQTTEGTAVVVDVLADNGNGPDADNENNLDPSRTVAFSLPLSGSLTDLGNGVFLYDPNGELEHLGQGETATVSFDYQVEDTSGATAVGTVTIEVQGENDAPGLTAGSTTVVVNEGETAVLSGTFADVDLTDTVMLTASSGTISQSNGRSGNWSWSLDTADGPDDSRTVTITATDSHGAIGELTFDVVVSNVAPIISVAGDAMVVAGEEYEITLGSITDPGADTVTGYQVHWGDGSSDSFLGDPTDQVLSHAYADAGSMEIAIELVDEDGSHSGTGTLAVTVLDTLSVTQELSTLFIRGDTATNSVEILESETVGEHTIRSTGATLINGELVSEVTFSGVTAIDVDLGLGLDVVDLQGEASNVNGLVDYLAIRDSGEGLTLTSTVGDFRSQGVLEISNADGPLSVNLDQPGNTFGRVVVQDGEGDAIVQLDSVTIQGNVSLDPGLGTNSVSIVDSAVSGNVESSSGSLSSFVVDGTTVNGYLSLVNQGSNGLTAVVQDGSAIGGYLSVISGAGSDSVSVADSTVGSDVGIDLGEGDNVLSLAGASVSGDVFGWSGSLSTVSLSGAMTTGYVSFINNGSNDLTVDVSHGSSIGEFLSVISGSGNDAISLSGSTVGDNFGVDLGEGVNGLSVSDGASVIGNLFAYRSADISASGAMAQVALSDSEVSGYVSLVNGSDEAIEVSLEAMLLGGYLSVISGNGNDSVSLSSTAVGGNVAYSLSGGEDVVSHGNVVLEQELSIYSGSGADTLRLEVSDDGVESLYRGDVFIQTEEGEDLIALAIDADDRAVFFADFYVDGGSEADTLDEVNAVFHGERVAVNVP